MVQHADIDHTGVDGVGVVPWALVPYYGNAGVAVGTVGAANRAIYIPCVLPAAATITGVRVGIGTSSGNLSVGLLNASGTRVATSGAVASPGTGLRNINFTASYAAAAGRYYLALSADNTTLTFHGEWTNPGAASCRFEESAHPIPATATFNATATGRQPAIIGLISGGHPS